MAAAPTSSFYRKLQEGRFVVSVEIDPPKGVNLERILEAVARFRASGSVDAVDINSGTLARVGMDAILLAGAIERAGMETIPHLTTRDLNIIGLQAMLLGAWSVGGVRNILAITGDPPILGDHPEVSGIYEVDAVGLVRILHRLNQGSDWAGKTLGGATHFCIGVSEASARRHGIAGYQCARRGRSASGRRLYRSVGRKGANGDRRLPRLSGLAPRLHQQ